MTRRPPSERVNPLLVVILAAMSLMCFYLVAMINGLLGRVVIQPR